jgi:hypothetical protein
MKLRALFLAFLLHAVTASSQEECGINTVAFISGEELHYKVIYNWGMVWLESGYAAFTTKEAVYNKRRCYLLNGSGSTYPKYDWFYKVRDVFETYLDSQTFRPLKFRADILEGKKNDKHTYLFDNRSQKAYTIINHGSKPVLVDTLSITACSIDVLTAIYYARSIDYSKYRVNDTVGISVILDGKLFGIYVRYLGKAVHRSKDVGAYNCIKFSPLLVEGSIFKAGEDMTVWVSDDENKLPVHIETPIIVGTIKVMLTSYKGLKFPERSKIKPEIKKRR